MFSLAPVVDFVAGLSNEPASGAQAKPMRTKRDAQTFDAYDRQTFGQLAKQSREAMQWSYARLERVTGIDRRLLWHAEQGSRPLPPEKRRALVNVLIDHIESASTKQSFLRAAALVTNGAGPPSRVTPVGSNDGGTPPIDPSKESWREFLGPLLRTTEVTRIIGIASAREINALVKRKKLLALPSETGELFYPAFQFNDEGAVYPDIETIIGIFDGIALTPYTVAAWLKGPKDDLNGETPIQWLERKRDAAPVIAAAEMAAARLAH